MTDLIKGLLNSHLGVGVRAGQMTPLNLALSREGRKFDESGHNHNKCMPCVYALISIITYEWSSSYMVSTGLFKRIWSKVAVKHWIVIA